MTFNEIKTAIKDRTNLTSTEADTRIAYEINDRYKRVRSTIGLNVTARTTVQTTATLGVSSLIFSGIEKVINVVDRSTTPYRILEEVSMEEMRAMEPSSATFATYYAIEAMGSSTVTIRMDAVPQGSSFTLYADGYANATTLSGSQVPAFAEDFHDILAYGVLADEYRKMEKVKLAVDAEQMYERRLSDLRMFIAKSAYATSYQGKKATLTTTGVAGAGGSSSSFDGSQSWTQTGLITFSRGTAVPFAVAAGSAKVANLKVEMDFLVVQVFS